MRCGIKTGTSPILGKAESHQLRFFYAAFIEKRFSTHMIIPVLHLTSTHLQKVKSTHLKVLVLQLKPIQNSEFQKIPL